MVIGGVVGLVVGSTILCVPGAILGAIGGAWVARSYTKRREQWKDEKQASVAPVATATHVGSASGCTNNMADMVPINCK